MALNFTCWISRAWGASYAQVMCWGDPAQWVWLMNADRITERETGWKLQLHALCLLKCFLEEQHRQHAAQQPPPEDLKRHLQSLSCSSCPCNMSRWHCSCCGSQTLRGGVVYHPQASKKTSESLGLQNEGLLSGMLNRDVWKDLMVSPTGTL